MPQIPRLKPDIADKPLLKWFRLNLSLILKKIDRVVIWILLALFLIFMISGYMITRGFIDQNCGLLLHTNLDLPIMFFFLVHTWINIRLLLVRRRVKHMRAYQALLALTVIGLMLLIIYLDQFLTFRW